MLRLHGHDAPPRRAIRAIDPSTELRAKSRAVRAGREATGAGDPAIAINPIDAAPSKRVREEGGWGPGTASAGERRGVRRRHFLA